MKEQWRAVVGFAGLYEVSDQGRVRGLDRMIGHPRGGLRRWSGRLLTATTRPDGYLEVSVCKDGKAYVRTVHTVVAEAFHGRGPPKHEVAHGNGVRGDCRASNLSWKTRKDNHADKIAHGTTNRGARHGAAVLTDSKVRQARVMAKDGLTHDVIAAHVGCSRSNISRVLRGEMWSHV